MDGKERKGDRQKLKMLYLAKIFSEETDAGHGLGMSEIIEKLAACGVNANRKTLYLDLEELRRFGMDITAAQPGRDCRYCLARRDFEPQDLRLLADAVQAAGFITDRRARKLVRKLETLAGRYEGKQLRRQVLVPGRVRTMNESGYGNIDKLHAAMDADRQVRFKYFQWDLKKKPELRRDGAWYRVSPWSLLWDGEGYRLLAFDGETGTLRSYRVDRMLRVSAANEKREGREQFKAFRLPRGVIAGCDPCGGETIRITMEAENEMSGVLMDRFGRDIPIEPTDEGHFRTTVSTVDGRELPGWLLSLGGGVRVTAPDVLVARIREEIASLSGRYGAPNP